MIASLPTSSKWARKWSLPWHHSHSHFHPIKTGINQIPLPFPLFTLTLSNHDLFFPAQRIFLPKVTQNSDTWKNSWNCSDTLYIVNKYLHPSIIWRVFIESLLNILWLQQILKLMIFFCLFLQSNSIFNSLSRFEFIKHTFFYKDEFLMSRWFLQQWAKPQKIFQFFCHQSKKYLIF